MQTTTIPFTAADGTPHSVRAEIRGLRHTIYLDERLCITHKAVLANDCAVYNLPLQHERAELYLHKDTPEWEVRLYLDDCPVDEQDELKLSQRLEFLVTAADISFREHCSRSWQPVAMRWGLWYAACVVIFSLIGGGQAILWGATAGFGLVFAVIAALLDLSSTYKLVRRLKTPSDCYQITDTV